MVVTTSTSVSLLLAVEAPALVRRSVLLLLVVPVVFVVVWSLKRVEVDRMGMSLGCLFGVICGWEEISLEWTTSVLLVLER